ncbi:MAG: hypothetical protein Q7I98_02170, partial [Erysipelotrichaceae bacterium]|nr:hypothetical protein [Erysipelotrichaceae bacterium]
MCRKLLLYAYLCANESYFNLSLEIALIELVTSSPNGYNYFNLHRGRKEFKMKLNWVLLGKEVSMDT